MVAGEPNTRISPANGVDLPMQALIGLAEVQIGKLVKQTLQVKGRVFADELHLNEVRLIDGLAAVESQYLKVCTYAWNY